MVGEEAGESIADDRLWSREFPPRNFCSWTGRPTLWSRITDSGGFEPKELPRRRNQPRTAEFPVPKKSHPPKMQHILARKITVAACAVGRRTLLHAHSSRLIVAIGGWHLGAGWKLSFVLLGIGGAGFIFLFVTQQKGQRPSAESRVRNGQAKAPAPQISLSSWGPSPCGRRGGRTCWLRRCW